MEIRNTSPLGDLDVTLLGRVVMAGEVIDVTEEQAVELCAGLANFAPVDPDDAFTDESFPGADKTRQLALLILEEFAAVVGGDLQTTSWRQLLAQEADRAAHRVRDRWHDRLRRDQQDDRPGAVAAALDVLVRFGLVRLRGDLVLIHPAAARYAARVTLHEQGSSGERSLFDNSTEGED